MGVTTWVPIVGDRALDRGGAEVRWPPGGPRRGYWGQHVRGPGRHEGWHRGPATGEPWLWDRVGDRGDGLPLRQSVGAPAIVGVRYHMREASSGYGVDKVPFIGLPNVLPSVPIQ